jgi:molybdate transport system substrate-binding protein
MTIREEIDAKAPQEVLQLLERRDVVGPLVDKLNELYPPATIAQGDSLRIWELCGRRLHARLRDVARLAPGSRSAPSSSSRGTRARHARIPAVGVARVDAHQPGQKGRAMIGKRLARNVAAAIGLAILLPGLTAPPAVSAAEIKVMSTVAMSATLDELKPKFEAATDHKVTFVYSVIADLRKRIQEGETADVMILSRAALDDLQGQGKVTSGSIVNVASSYVAIAVRAGATKPDIGSVDALKRTLLAVKSIVYADPAKGGASGVHFARVLDRLGITDQMKFKTVLVPGAQAADVVARGEAEMGVAQASEIVPIAGAQLVGPLPGDLNNVTIFSAGIGPASKDAAAAKAFIQYVTGPVGAGALKSKGMDPS